MKKPERKYYRFSEANDWEGETWNFYIPINGNEEAVRQLKTELNKWRAYCMQKWEGSAEFAYSISNRTYSTSEVNLLIREDGGCSYMAAHNKLSGKLSLPVLKEKDQNKQFEEFEGHLYKGGIRNLVA